MALHSSPNPHSLTQGHLVRTDAFRIPDFLGSHPLTIYVPPGYALSDQRYPVAYMFDGQNLFGDEGSYSGGWHLHQVLDERAREGKVVPLVVGIHHGGVTRKEELCPWPIEDWDGRGDEFIDWIAGTLMPMIQSEWRVLRGPEHTMVGGSSLGGLLAYFTFFHHPGAFGKSLSMSPSIWTDPTTCKRIAFRPGLPGNRRLYIDAGSEEVRTMKTCQEVVDHLYAIGYQQGVDVLWTPEAGADHNERAWHRRLPKALDFLLGQ